MPELEYALLADFVRLEGGIAHVLGANIDTVLTGEVPTGRNIGILAVISFEANELEQEYLVEVALENAAGERLAEVRGAGHHVAGADLPEGWQHKASFGINFGVFFPDYGVYTFSISVGEGRGRPQKQLGIRVSRIRRTESAAAQWQNSGTRRTPETAWPSEDGGTCGHGQQHPFVTSQGSRIKPSARSLPGKPRAPIERRVRPHRRESARRTLARGCARLSRPSGSGGLRRAAALHLPALG